MIVRERPNPTPRRSPSVMTRVSVVSGAGSSPRRLAACGVTTHNRPAEAGHPGNPGLDHTPGTCYTLVFQSQGGPSMAKYIVEVSWTDQGIKDD
jgi:hypothetical protein